MVSIPSHRLILVHTVAVSEVQENENFLVDVVKNIDSVIPA